MYTNGFRIGDHSEIRFSSMERFKGTDHILELIFVEMTHLPSVV